MSHVTTPVVEGSPSWYVKRAIPIRAVKMAVQFTVETLEGVMTGKAGDYLIIGVRGEKYPCDAAIFEESYYMVSDEERCPPRSFWMSDTKPTKD